MLLVLVVDALLIGKNVRVITQKKLGSCHGTMVKKHKEEKKAYNQGYTEESRVRKLWVQS